MDFSKVKPRDCIVNASYYDFSDRPMKYLFVDFDGTVRRTVDNTGGKKSGKGYGSKYPRVPPNTVEEVSVFPITDKLKQWVKAGYRIVGVTNQSGIQFGYISMETTREICKETVRQLGVPFPVIFAPCKDGPQEISRLRKPNTGMIDLTIDTFGPILRNHSYMVGDYKTDIQMGKAAKLITVHVDSTKEGKDFPEPPKV
jgi:histidinol-phosphate phosphatase family protein